MKTNKIIILFIAILLTYSCKKTDAVEPFTNSVLPSNYVNQGTIEVKSSTLKICVWDYSVVDGDVIDLLINGRKMLTNFSLTEEQECIELTLPKGENWIGVSAINEGFLPPASPHVEISDGKSVQAFDLSAYINKPGGYKIKVVL